MDLSVATREQREGFFVVEIDRFQGPLDLLLHLIRTQDIDIFDIPVSTITDQLLVRWAREKKYTRSGTSFLSCWL